MNSNASKARWSGFVFWVALEILGQAATLRAIDAGTRLHFQHLRLLEAGPLILLCIALQTACVIPAIWKVLPQISHWIRQHFRWWQIAGIGGVMVLTSAAPSAQAPAYLLEIAFVSLLQGIHLANLILVARAFPAEHLDSLRTMFEKHFAGSKEANCPRLDRFAIYACLWVTVISILLNIFSYQKHPHVTDEVVYYLQARFLANGSITLPAPPVPEAFEVNLMEVKGDRWYPAPPAGWPAVLSLGMKLGVPWLVNPVLSGINVLLIYLLIHGLYDRGVARLSVLFLCTSPWYLCMGMNMMTHMLTLTCALIAALSLVQARNTGRIFWCLPAGMAIGYTSLIRPLDGLIIGIMLGVWAIGIGGRRLRWSALLLLVLTSAATGALVFPYNKHLTGNARLYPINEYNDLRSGKNANAYGFGPDRGMGWEIDPFPGHGPVDGMVNALLNGASINAELLGWSTGSILLAAFLIFSAAKIRTKSDWLMLGVIGFVFVFYFFYYFSGGPDFGARYWFLMIVPLIALTSRGMLVLMDRCGTAGYRVPVAVLILCSLSILNYVPWRATDKYYHYLGMRPDILSLSKQNHFGNGIVLIRGKSFPDYASASVYNPLDLTVSEPIYVWDRDPESRNKVLHHYAGRNVWLVDGPSITGDGYRVVRSAGVPPALQVGNRSDPRERGRPVR